MGTLHERPLDFEQCKPPAQLLDGHLDALMHNRQATVFNNMNDSVQIFDVDTPEDLRIARDNQRRNGLLEPKDVMFTVSTTWDGSKSAEIGFQYDDHEEIVSFWLDGADNAQRSAKTYQHARYWWRNGSMDVTDTEIEAIKALCFRLQRY